MPCTPRRARITLSRLALLALLCTFLAAASALHAQGQLVATEPDLPLGVVRETNYCVTELALRRGQSLTLITDGVVEATDPRTHELFGFARTEAISRQSADSIAWTAHAFGVPQADDITVLTLGYPA